MPAKKDYGDGNLRWTSGPGRGGRFAPRGGRSGGATATAGSGPVRAPKPAALKRASHDQVLDWFHQVSQRPAGTPGVEEALAALDVELTRREAAEVDLRAKSRRVDELWQRGASYAEAWAEVHGADPAKLAVQERMAIVDAYRHKGEPRAKAIRRMYDERVTLEVMQADDETRGNLLNRAGRAAGIDPASLWEGTTARARKYASDELKAWWETHGGRKTRTQFSAQFTGDKAAAERSRRAGTGRDYGV